MKIYQGFRSSNTPSVFVDNVQLEPKASRNVRDHSTDFEWGYRGSGPTQLALALMLDFFNDDENTALEWYLYFRDDIVNDMDIKGWVLLDTQIQDWYDEKKKRLDDNTPPDGYGSWWL